MALADREAILEYIAQDNGTDAVEFLRVLHATQQWPAQKKAK